MMKHKYFLLKFILLTILSLETQGSQTCKLFFQSEKMHDPINKVFDYTKRLRKKEEILEEPLSQEEKSELEVKGFQLHESMMIFDSIGLAALNGSDTFALKKEAGTYQYYAQIKTGFEHESKKPIILESKKLVTCEELLKKQKIDQQSRLFVKKAMDYFQKNQIGKAILAMEQVEFIHDNKDLYKFEVLERRYDHLLRKVIKQIENKADPEEKLLGLRQVLLKNDLINYSRDLTTITDFLIGRGGNCVTRTVLFLAMITELSLKAPKDTTFGVEVFSDHLQVVLYRPKSKLVHDLVYLKDSPLRTNIYSFDFFLNNIFNKRNWFLLAKEKAHLTPPDQNFIWENPVSAQLDFNDMISPKEKRVDIFNSDNLSSQAAFSQGEVPQNLDETYLLNSNSFSGDFRSASREKEQNEQIKNKINNASSGYANEDSFIETINYYENYVVSFYKDLSLFHDQEIFLLQKEFGTSLKLKKYSSSLIDKMNPQQIADFFPELPKELYKHPLPLFFVEKPEEKSAFRKGWRFSNIYFEDEANRNHPYLTIFTLDNIDHNSYEVIKNAPANEKWKTLFQVVNHQLLNRVNKMRSHLEYPTDDNIFQNIIFSTQITELLEAMNTYDGLYIRIIKYFGLRHSKNEIFKHNNFPEEDLKFVLKKIYEQYIRYMDHLLDHPHQHLMWLNAMSEEKLDEALNQLFWLGEIFDIAQKKFNVVTTFNTDRFIYPTEIYLNYLLRSPNYEYFDKTSIELKIETYKEAKKKLKTEKIDLPKISVPHNFCQGTKGYKYYKSLVVDCSKHQKVFNEKSVLKRKKVHLNKILFERLTSRMFYSFSKGMTSPWNLLMYHYLLTPNRYEYINEQNSFNESMFFFGVGLKSSIWSASKQEIINSGCYKDFSPDLACVTAFNKNLYQKIRSKNQVYPNWVLDFPQYKPVFDKVMKNQHGFIKSFDEKDIPTEYRNNYFLYDSNSLTNWHNYERTRVLDIRQREREFIYPERDAFNILFKDGHTDNIFYVKNDSFYTYPFLSEKTKEDSYAIYYMPININLEEIIYDNTFELQEFQSGLEVKVSNFLESLL